MSQKPDSDTGQVDYAAKIKDLEEKLLTFRIKRAEDSKKLQEMERIKIQNQQLLEFKKQILESRAELSKQLNQAKKEAEEAVTEKARHAEEMKDLAETAEIATLDKEMAEEKYEQLLKEHETLKEKYEEISIDFELLKSEIDMQGEGVSNAYEVKQLQLQNARYNEAIIKLRDLLSADKVEIQGLQKDLKDSLNQVSELQRLKEKHEKDIASLETNISDLKEQIDDALGSQEMVEILTEKNLELEDKVKTLQEEIDDLEKIHEINEQLQEGARDTELELREELDLNRSKIAALLKKIEDNQEALANYETTIQKFRELVKQLRDENADLRKQGNLAQTQSQEQQVENIEFKMRFAESKAVAYAVEMDLRRLEITQYKIQIRLLSKFLPQSFFMPGGDHDAIQVLLFVVRVSEKCDIISRQMDEKFPLTEDKKVSASVDSGDIIKKTNENQLQQSFTRRLLFLLSSIKTILSQYTDSLKSCSIELYLKIASLYPELKTHEKVIDGFIELLKKDRLDETVSLDNLEKALNYFVSLYNLHLADNKVINCRDLLSNFVLIMKSGVDVSLLDVAMIDKCISPNAEGRERIDMLKTYLEDIQEFSRKVHFFSKRQLNADNNSINLSPILENEVRDCIIQMFKAVGALYTIRKTIVEATTVASTEADEIILFQGLQEIDAMITQTGGFKFLEVSLNGIMSVCSQLSTGLQQGDFEGEVKRTENIDEDRLDPLEARAQYVTDQSGKLSEYKIKLESKENEINELKKALKLKISETSEMQIRKDLAEKKLLSATKSSNEKVGKLQAELDEHRDMTRRREREYEETLNHYQADIEALESERNELKEKVKILSKRTIFEGLTKSVTSLNTAPRHDTSPSSSLSPLESGYMQSIAALRNALKIVKDENIKLKCRLEEKKLKIDNVKFNSALSRTKPLWYLKVTGKLIGNIDDGSGGDKMKSLYIKERNLLNKIEKFRHEARMKLINQKLFDPEKSLRDQIVEEQIEKRKLQVDYDKLSGEIIEFVTEKKSALLY